VIRPFGEHALLVELDGWEAARRLADDVAAAPIAGVEATIPALSSVLVELEPAAAHRAEEIAAALRARIAAPGREPGPGRRRTVPIAYGGEYGPDLADVAALTGLSPDEIVARHAGTELRVLFCGFAAGYAYLGELPEPLRVPRLETPRTRTPAGSVAIAGTMSGIYPAELPGGWRVIGRTPLVLFDPRREPPAYLAPGDTVLWQRIDADAWPDQPVVAEDW
jgi:KipI family sensor histidine kinase inhibitor